MHKFINFRELFLSFRDILELKSIGRSEIMSGSNFFKGAAVGIVLGSTLGMIMMPEQRPGTRKKVLGKAIRTVGELVENFTDFICK